MSDINSVSEDGPLPTPTEVKLCLVLLANMTNKLEVDWNDIAAKMGYSNGASASTRWRQVSKRLGIKPGYGAGGDGTTTGTPRKAKGGNTGAPDAATPSKKRTASGAGIKKTQNKKKAAIKEVESEPEVEDEDEAEVEDKLEAEKEESDDIV